MIIFYKIPFATSKSKLKECDQSPKEAISKYLHVFGQYTLLRNLID